MFMATTRGCCYKWNLHLVQNVDTSGLSYRLVDAKGQVVGRLAAQLAVLLQVGTGSLRLCDALRSLTPRLCTRHEPSGSYVQGKDKPTFAPHENSGDVVVVVNARHAEFTGRKWNNKLYKWHTGWVAFCCKAVQGSHAK